jgi:hypothetical protein
VCAGHSPEPHSRCTTAVTKLCACPQCVAQPAAMRLRCCRVPSLLAHSPPIMVLHHWQVLCAKPSALPKGRHGVHSASGGRNMGWVVSMILLLPVNTMTFAQGVPGKAAHTSCFQRHSEMYALLDWPVLSAGALVAAEHEPASSGGALAYAPHLLQLAPLYLPCAPPPSYIGDALDCSPWLIREQRRQQAQSCHTAVRPWLTLQESVSAGVSRGSLSKLELPHCQAALQWKLPCSRGRQLQHGWPS